jgi:hypothetical protein
MNQIGNQIGSQLAKFIINGLSSINKITENIDLNRTTEKYIESQLKSIKQINAIKTENDFFNFLEKNDKYLKNITIYCIIPIEKQTIKEHISSYFKNINTKYNGNKLFFFYFQIVLVENFINSNGNDLKRQDLKTRLENLLKSSCQTQKLEMKNCLSKNYDKIEVIVMSDLDKNINKVCNNEAVSLEKCISTNLKMRQ